VEVLDRGLRLFPDFTDLVYLKAISRFMLGDTDSPPALLQQCLEMGDAPWHKYPSNPGTGGFKALCSLGVILAQRGDLGKALPMLVQAASLPDALEEAMESLTQVLVKSKMSVTSFLEENNLLNPRNLSLVAGALAKMGLYRDSLQYLTTTSGLIQQAPSPRDFNPLFQGIHRLVAGFCQDKGKDWPQDFSWENCLRG
jgi:hypothetical protein